MSYARPIFFALITLALAFSARAADHPDQAAAKTLLTSATSSTNAYTRLAYMCDTFGPRFSGSTNLESSIDWILAEMKRDGFVNVRGEPVVIPRWVRGQESLELIGPRRQSLPMLGLGGSIATPKDGLNARVFVVKSFEELAQRRTEAIGRIVVFNVPYDDYHKTVAVRTLGAEHQKVMPLAEAIAMLKTETTPPDLRG